MYWGVFYKYGKFTDNHSFPPHYKQLMRSQTAAALIMHRFMSTYHVFRPVLRTHRLCLRLFRIVKQVHLTAELQDKHTKRTRQSVSARVPASNTHCILGVFKIQYALGVAQTSGLQCRDALSLTSTSRWSYRGRNRIINPHLRSVSKLIDSLNALHKT